MVKDYTKLEMLSLLHRQHDEFWKYLEEHAGIRKPENFEIRTCEANVFSIEAILNASIDSISHIGCSHIARCDDCPIKNVCRDIDNYGLSEDEVKELNDILHKVVSDYKNNKS